MTGQTRLGSVTVAGMEEAVKYPRTATTKVTGPFEAECPEDGGKWAIYCEHFDAEGNLTYASILQDTNRARARSWKKHPGEWCGLCQEESRGGSHWTFFHPYSTPEEDPTREESPMNQQTINPTDGLDEYLQRVLKAKPYVVAVKYPSSRKPRYLAAEKARRITTTTAIATARGFATQAEAILWITENERHFQMLEFFVANRHEIETARIQSIRDRASSAA